MSNYSALKTDINNNIYENNTQQITGTVLNTVLKDMVAVLGAGYQFAGCAYLDLNPGAPDAKVFYLAGEGLYPNFDNIQVPAGKLGILKWDTRWRLETIEGLGGGGANLTGYISLPSTSDLPEEGQPTIGYLIGENLYLYVGTGGDTADGKYQNCGGFRGPEGVGITDIEQVVESVENGGRNTIRITLSDGHSYDVYVRNGKASQGLFPDATTLNAQRPNPSVGEYAFVGSGFPADIYVCNTAGTWTDSGADYDGDSVDLTDYATKAELNQLEAKVVGIPNETQNGFIYNGVWKDLSSPDRKHKVFEIPSTLNGAALFIKSSTYKTDIAFLSSYSPSEGANTGIIEVHTAVSNTITEHYVVPSTARYVYLLWESGAMRVPDIITIGGFDFLLSVKDNLAYNILSTENSKELISGDVTSVFGFDNPLLSWKVGTMENGSGLEEQHPPVTYRVMTGNVFFTSQPIHIKALPGYKFLVYKYNEKGVGIEWYPGGWRSEQTIESGLYIRVTIKKDPEDTSITADIPTFVGNIVVESVAKEIADTNIKIDFVLNKEYFGFINTVTGTWEDIGTGERTYKIAEISGRKKLHIKGNNSGSSVFAFLSEYAPISGSSYGIISSTVLSLGEEKFIDIPSTTKYLYMLWVSGTERSPQVLEIDDVDYYDSIKDKIVELAKSANETSNDFGDIYGDTNFAWRLGTIDNATGGLDLSVNYRVVGGNIIKAKRDITISVDDGFRLVIGTYSDSGAWLGYSGTWVSVKTIQEGTFFRVMIRKDPENVSTPADVAEFSGAFHYVSLVDIIMGLSPQQPTILSLNPEEDVLPKISNLKRRYIRYGGSSTEYPPVLVLAHYSDVHADNDNILRIKEFTDKYPSYIDDVIQTGDIIGGSFRDGMPSAYAQTQGTLNVIGNHDSMNYVDGNWELVDKKEVYDEVLAPYVSGWGVTQPTNASENGYCYYFKDYADNGIRLVCLDNLHWDASQKSWFEGVLSDAITESLDVIVAVHYPPFYIEQDKNNPFASIDIASNSVGFTNAEAANAVKTFINDGGTFVCWLCGHIHQDVMGLGRVSDGFQNQLAISIATAGIEPSENYSEMERLRGTRTQDCFNIIGIDTQSKTIKVMRIGANYDRYMRRKNTLSWDYGTSQMIYTDK